MVIDDFISPFWMGQHHLTLEQLEMHGGLLSTVATDALLLKHQTINTDNADQRLIELDLFDV